MYLSMLWRTSSISSIEFLKEKVVVVVGPVDDGDSKIHLNFPQFSKGKNEL